MARKLFTEETLEDNTMASEITLPRVKQLLRSFGPVANEEFRHIQEVDEEVSNWLANGYKLFATHYVGSISGQAYSVLYILIKE